MVSDIEDGNNKKTLWTKIQQGSRPTTMNRLIDHAAAVAGKECGVINKLWFTFLKTRFFTSLKDVVS
jgi:hypothetical protein